MTVSAARVEAVPLMAGTVALMASALGVGGAERQLVNLAKLLDRRGHRVVVVLFRNEGALRDELRASGIPVISVNKRAWWDPVFLVRLWRLLRRLHVGVLYSYLESPNVVSALLRPALPRIRVVWGVRSATFTLPRSQYADRLVFGLTRWVVRWADVIIANSQAGARYYINRYRYPQERVVVVPNGIDTGRFAPDLEGGRTFRAHWGIPADAPVIGCVARLDPMKDHAILLQAFAHVMTSMPDAWLICVGEGDAVYGAELRRLAETLAIQHRVIWAGMHATDGALYSAFSVAVGAAQVEGFPNWLAEAMSSGVPCVATDVGDSGFVLSGLGRLVLPGDAQALAAALVQTLRYPPHNGTVLRNRVVQHFSLDSLLEATEYHLGLSGSRPASDSSSSTALSAPENGYSY